MSNVGRGGCQGWRVDGRCGRRGGPAAGAGEVGAAGGLSTGLGGRVWVRAEACEAGGGAVPRLRSAALRIRRSDMRGMRGLTAHRVFMQRARVVPIVYSPSSCRDGSAPGERVAPRHPSSVDVEPAVLGKACGGEATATAQIPRAAPGERHLALAAAASQTQRARFSIFQRRRSLFHAVVWQPFAAERSITIPGMITSAISLE